MTAHHDGPKASGAGFFEKNASDIVFVSELQRDTIQRNPVFPNSSSACPKIGAPSAFLADPVLLILLQSLRQANLRCRIFGTAMFQEFARHRLQHMKQRDLHIASLTQQGPHIAHTPAEGSESSTAIEVRQRTLCPRGTVVQRVFGFISHQTYKGEQWNSSTTGKTRPGKIHVAHADRVRWVPLEEDLLIVRERIVDIRREPIEVAEGGIAPNSASGNRP